MYCLRLSNNIANIIYICAKINVVSPLNMEELVHKALMVRHECDRRTPEWRGNVSGREALANCGKNDQHQGKADGGAKTVEHGLHEAFRLLHVQQGDAEHGTSVHFVTPELDGGPVVAQARLRVEPDDDELTVFGLNSGEGEIIYNTSLYEVKIYGERGTGEGQFLDPLGIDAEQPHDRVRGHRERPGAGSGDET